MVDDCAAFLDRSIILLLSSLTSGLLLMIATVIGTFLVWLYHALAASSFFEHLSLSKKNPRLSLFRHFSGTFSRFCVGSFSGLFGQFWSRTFQLFTYVRSSSSFVDVDALVITRIFGPKVASLIRRLARGCPSIKQQL